MRIMQARRRHTVRLVSTWALLFVNGWFAGLAFYDRLSYTQPSEYEVLHLAADSDLWGWLFGLSALALLVCLVTRPQAHPKITSRICSVSAALLGVWAFFTLLWVLSAVSPVSLGVCVPAVFAVVGAQVLAVSWNQME